MSKQRLCLFLGPSAFLFVQFLAPMSHVPGAANAVLASALWIACWWITEAVPIPVTSLLPIVLFPLSGGLGIKETTAAYGSPLIFLFIGGFMLAIAIEKWNLHRRIAMNIIRALGTNCSRIILGFMLATAGLSMWISNTATTMMMMPIGLAIIQQMSDGRANETKEQVDEKKLFGKALMLAIAYSASIGGMATLIGTPTNVIFAGIVKTLFNIEVTFAQWFLFGLPMTLLLLAISWFYLVRVAFSLHTRNLSGGEDEIKKQIAALGRFGWEEKWVLAVFTLTALAWITRSFLLQKFIPGLDDTIIAIIAASSLFVIPARSKPDTRILDWSSAAKLPWGIILLFGGGLALAAGFKQSGLAELAGNQMGALQGVPFIVLMAVVVATVNFLTEITSNVATASMILPVLASLSTAIGVHPLGLMVAATVAASCAFMLPVATPPNAVVFGSGQLRMQDMVKAGFRMNLISILLLALYVYYLLPVLWNIELIPAGG